MALFIVVKKLHQGIYIDIFKKERGDNGMESGSLCSPEPDGRHRRIMTVRNYTLHSVIKKVI